MTAVITHSVSAGGVVDPTASVDGAAWDANHVITGIVDLAQGGTNSDLSATGGAGQVLKQASAGAAVSVGTVAASEIASGAALTKTDDTNVTLTLGGAPTTALLAATSITVGWTGTLAAGRGGFGADISAQSGVPLFATGTPTFTGTTGTGNFVLANSPTLVTPALGTPSAAVLTNATGLPISSGVSGLGTDVATFLATPSSANLAAAVTDETGSGALVFAVSPALTGTPTAPTASASDNSTKIATTAYVDAQVSGSVSGVSSLNGQTGALALMIQPQGRLTLTTGTAVMASSTVGQTTVYYTPYCGNQCPIYDGTNFVPTTFSELSQATTDTTKSPAAVANNSNYDIFVWNDSGTIRATRGPAWTSDTARGTGAGTTELELVNGVYLNKVAITNGPAANRGTYVGTIRSNGTATIDWQFGAVASGGTAGIFGVWNAYNRVTVATQVMDNVNSWTYAVNATWRAVNANTKMRVSAVRGLDIDGVEATYYAIGRTTAGGTGISGIGVNSTTAYSGTTSGTINTTDFLALPARYSGLMGLGYCYVSAIEYNDSTNTTTWRGLITSLPMQSGLHAVLRQ